MNKRLTIRANNGSEGTLHLKLGREDFKLEVMAAKGDSKLPRFKIHAYTGKVIGQPWGRVIVDGTGIKLRDVVKILMNHDPHFPVGHTDAVKQASDGNVFLEGPVSGPGSADYIKDFLEASGNGFPYESSIGADVVRSEYLEAGETAIVNGIEVTGPLTIARETDLYETSVVTFGADSDTTAMAAGKNAPTFFGNVQGEQTMFEKWLKANGFDLAKLSEDQEKSLRAAYDAEVKLKASQPDGGPAGAPVIPVVAPVKATAPVAGDDDTDARISAMQKTIDTMAITAADATRVAGITTICAGNYEDLSTTAIAEKWSVSQVEAQITEIKKVEGNRPVIVPNINFSKHDTAGAVLAGAMMSNGIKADAIKGRFSEDEMDAGSSIQCVGFSDLAGLLLAANGYNTTGMSPMAIIEAGFTTGSLPKALGDLANTSLMAGYKDPADSIGLIAAMVQVKNFKKGTQLQMDSDMVLKEVGANGEIEHAQVGEESYDFFVKQHARKLVTSRMDLIDDELGVFTGFHNGFGRGASLAEQLKFWTMFAASESNGHFSVGNGNLLSNLLSIDGLTAAVTALGSQVDKWGMPIDVTGMNLVVPTALVPYAKQIVKSTLLHPVYNNDKAEPITNPHVGEFKVIESKWLNNAKVGNQSTTAWYLLADSDDIASFASVHRTGMNGPETRTAALPVGDLGIASDAVYDFGAALVNPKGAVKSTGTA